MNNSNNIFQQKRILLAVVLSFIFFVVYDYFFIPKHPVQREQNVSQNTSVQNTANAAPIQTHQASHSSLKNFNSSSTKENVIAHIQSAHFEAQIDSLGRIINFYLKDEKYKDEKGEFLNLINKENSPYPLEIRFSDSKLNNEAFYTNYTSSSSEVFIDENGSQTLKLTQDLSQLRVEKILTFYSKGNYQIEVKLSKNAHYFISPGLRPNIAVDSYTVHGALAMDTTETLHTYEDGDMKNDENKNNVVLASAFDRYYATFFYNFDDPLNITISKDSNSNPIVFAYSENEFKAGAYIGSKEHSVLQSIDSRLDAVVEYGWFTFIAKPMFEFLNFLYQYIGNWGWAIAALTLIIRVVLFPLTYKSMISMNKLKELAPKMKDIREKYKGDPQKMNVQMMELYKKHGANPMSGCLPIFLQIPIFFAIYRVLLNAIELKAAPWIFWIYDLSAMDPYFILPVLMGVTMFLQQLITPMSIQDPLQAKIMKFLPLIFTFFFITFPAGLTLYWFINNLCSLVQQWIINKLFEKEHNKKQSEAKNDNRS
ncbi:membrane protein insertase YidC [Campylobacter sp. MIT 21-1685]|uniref:membrane protein insertase YidC n=1 Tax=unclassified Campylobacter TaxID=2593542 RepID=UPI00224AF73D|nr:MULTISPECIES: membrane protein insertase YidC [unclassified Campylobacter]MCX2683095.1 membrane protein insertase YidC [Campylobacter sp. MIT 21-1684]MCX2751445.1 membrane protein insertase YidC [Campylobacter sp. MIT 21-1682]MCX2807645.1 membrane protein insertase YidC [Campylobacter sp. MIT 21-1685]